MKNFIEKMTKFVEEKIAPPLVKLSQTRYLTAISNTFMALMSLLIFGSLFCLVASLPFPGWSDLVAPICAQLWGGFGTTMGYISLLLAPVLGYYLGESYNAENKEITPLATAILSFTSFMMFFPTNADGAIPAGNFGSTGIFTAIFVTIISVEIYRFFINRKIVIKMPEGVPPMVMQAFVSLIPAVVVWVAWWLIAQIACVDLPTIINTLFAPLVAAGKGPVTQFLSFVLDRLIWFTGIHGSNVVGSVMTPIWNQMIAENMEATAAGLAAPNLFTAEWCNYFVRISVTPLCVLAATSKLKRFSALGKLALPASIFNIAEPIMYGLPLVLNPLLFIPWVFGWAILWIWTYVFTAIIPVIPAVIAQVTWTVPAPIAAYLATGSLPAALFSLANYFILYLMFLPFFRIYEKQEMAKEEEENAQ